MLRKLNHDEVILATDVRYYTDIPEHTLTIGEALPVFVGLTAMQVAERWKTSGMVIAREVDDAKR